MGIITLTAEKILFKICYILKTKLVRIKKAKNSQKPQKIEIYYLNRETTCK